MGGAAVVWETETGASRPSLPKGHVSGNSGLAVSSDGCRIAAGGWRGELKLWSTEHDESAPAFAVRLWLRDWEEARFSDDLHGPCVFPEASGTNALALVPAPDFSVQGWDLARNRRRFVLTGHTNRITSIASVAFAMALTNAAAAHPWAGRRPGEWTALRSGVGCGQLRGAGPLLRSRGDRR